MIKFGSNDKCENIGILEKEEAEAYIEFLDEERERHEEEIESLGDAVGGWEDREGQYAQSLVQFWQSAIRRHQKDIEGIDALISTVKGFYGI